MIEDTRLGCDVHEGGEVKVQAFDECNLDCCLLDSDPCRIHQIRRHSQFETRSATETSSTAMLRGHLG